MAPTRALALGLWARGAEFLALSGRTIAADLTRPSSGYDEQAVGGRMAALAWHAKSGPAGELRSLDGGTRWLGLP